MKIEREGEVKKAYIFYLGTDSIGMRLWIRTMDGRDRTDALKTRWATSYNIHEPLDRGKTDTKQVRDTHQTGARTMTFNTQRFETGCVLSGQGHRV